MLLGVVVFCLQILGGFPYLLNQKCKRSKNWKCYSFVFLIVSGVLAIVFAIEAVQRSFMSKNIPVLVLEAATSILYLFFIFITLYTNFFKRHIRKKLIRSLQTFPSTKQPKFHESCILIIVSFLSLTRIILPPFCL